MLDLMSLENKIEENDGCITTEDVLDLGFSKQSFYNVLDKLNLEKYSHGIYKRKDIAVDDLYLIQKRFPKAIFSLETALYLHGYAVREPNKYCVTIPANYNSAHIKKMPLLICYANIKNYTIEIVEAKTIYGNTVKVYSMERTVCDILKNKNSIDIQNFQYVMNNYLRSSKVNIDLLMNLAKLFKIEKKLKIYTEVLLG